MEIFCSSMVWHAESDWSYDCGLNERSDTISSIYTKEKKLVNVQNRVSM